MIQVLVIWDYYIPGFRGGGPIASLSHLVEWLGGEVQFSIVARDRDLGDRHPYPGIKRGCWQMVNGAKVFYVRPWGFWLPGFLRLLRQTPYDVLYLQGFFPFPTISALLARRLGLIPARPVIIASRGDFHPAGLLLKPRKKRLYTWVAKRLRLYNKVVWQATSEMERTEILHGFGKEAEVNGSSIVIAPNLPPRDPLLFASAARPAKKPGEASVIFLSRIARKKGLDLALRALARVKGKIEFDIYGPIEDSEYWRECEGLMESLPSWVRANYRGAVRPAEVPHAFAGYHLFLFPTRGENFGHVILESLVAGCPVLVGDTTPWMNLAESGAGWVFPLSDVDGFARAMDSVIAMDAAEFDRMSHRAYEYGRRICTSSAAIEANRQMFLEALDSAAEEAAHI
jgi:glycosyltransferase involved in cell wall biosynthesis